MMSIAAVAAPSSAMVTKPKPRERPVSRSVITTASSTVPCGSKAARRLSLLVAQARPPTKSFVPISLLLSLLNERCPAAATLTW